ncbi:AMP deaminase [Heracleum sosnowskyi]|uniref:AMP deaminase n=1 Tax=Heracleum sosnowskyi TaxID=360622 RepID=A0AAD8I955_9APIA|nr:AMP deaminase [Heracleum sosnowskyi]
MDSSSSSTSLHLALATLFGASVMAISAFYIHKRSVDQVLHRLNKLRRKSSRLDTFTTNENKFVSDADVYKFAEYSRGIEVDESSVEWYRVSSSVPNVGSPNEWLNQDSINSMSNSMEINLIPSGLPPLRTDHTDGEKMRVASVGRLVTPRSSGGYAFESVEHSDEEVMDHTIEEDNIYCTYDENLVSSADHASYADIQAVSDLAPEAENLDFIQSQNHNLIANETSGNGQGSRKGDTSSLYNIENDKVSARTILPLPTSAHESLNIEDEEVRRMIRECLDLREKYVYREETAPWMKSTEDLNVLHVNSDPFHFVPVEATSHHFRMEDGVIHVYASETDTVDLFPVASATTFFTDMHHLLRIISVGNVRSACYHRLRFLEEKFRLHLLVNGDREFLAQKSAPHRDFYNIRKVDTHVHHSACMNQKHLLRFIKSKLRSEPDEVVIFRDGQYLTLKEVFESLDLNGYDLNVDLLDVHADKSTFHRFDTFNLKYNPCGQSRLREIFLKQDNLIQGRFLGEVTKQVLLDLEASKYQMAEYRVSIYGRKQSEWDQLASWFINNSIYSDNAVWLIQLPRLYNVYRSMGTVTSFQTILDNVFIPLFEVTVNPKSHPQLHVFLMQVVGFDIVDDESKPERRPTKHMPKPSEWTNDFNPAYSYYAYYIYANLFTLNKLREAKGLRTIRFRPHCGEAGDVDHLAAGLLLCHNISHGINLRKSPVLQYLYYLAQVGLAMSPLSNNSLFLDYHRNPFPLFFQRGLNVSLSSDDPLQIHLTKEALVEEYSVAAKVWKLSSCDMCEIARNSVYQSGFSHAAKSHWLGKKYFKQGPEGNDIHKTNVPHMRISFRHETWKEEMLYVYSGKSIVNQVIGRQPEG